jgi:hypothetical protein
MAQPPQAPSLHCLLLFLATSSVHIRVMCGVFSAPQSNAAGKSLGCAPATDGRHLMQRIRLCLLGWHSSLLPYSHLGPCIHPCPALPLRCVFSSSATLHFVLSRPLLSSLRHRGSVLSASLAFQTRTTLHLLHCA